MKENIKDNLAIDRRQLQNFVCVVPRDKSDVGGQLKIRSIFDQNLVRPADDIGDIEKTKQISFRFELSVPTSRRKIQRHTRILYRQSAPGVYNLSSKSHNALRK